jgi:hypothetical protein
MGKGKQNPVSKTKTFFFDGTAVWTQGFPLANQMLTKQTFYCLSYASILQECKSGYNKDTCTPKFISALFTIVKLWKQPRCPTTDKWIKKMTPRVWFEGKWMQLKDIMLSEVSQVQNDKVYNFSHMQKTDPKYNHIHKNKHYHMQTYM